ncbi:MAG: cysteine-rich KTR domain-containing protein [Candidatus Avispirillum sp.]
MEEATWIICPVCKKKTRYRIRTDSVLENFPLYCHRCRQETLINAKNLKISPVRARRTDAEPLRL